MYLYYQYGSTDEAIPEIAEKVKRSEAYISKMIQAGMRNTSLVDFYIKYADDEDEDEETIADVTADYTTEPSAILMRIELHKLLKKAFAKLNYKDREMLYSHLGLCPECMRSTKPRKTFREIAYENELSSAQAAEDAVKRA